MNGCRIVAFSLGLLVACALPATTRASQPVEIDRLPLEFPDDPPVLTQTMIHAKTRAASITFGAFTSVQVNVDVTGANVLDDAANEPSIAVDPNDPARMAIGWRQFDSIKSNFRQAGFGYTVNGGLTWSSGTIDPGVFRSDPVLAADEEGRFYYDSLLRPSKSRSRKKSFLFCDLFASTDGGRSWGAPVDAFGGDKEWITVDRTAGTGRGNLYEAWSIAGSATGFNTFSRSLDEGESFEAPSGIPGAPIWGTLDVGADGTVYVVGIGPTGFAVSRSSNAGDPGASPTFTTSSVDLGGFLFLGPPNPEGLLGQPWIAADRSSGPRSGWIYVLCSVRTPTDPLDVMFVRSTDGGQTWSAPVRVNDDAPGTRAFQWFGTMSVAPNGRIDVVWNDTRGSADSTKSALFYTHSEDGGTTWAPNLQASPTWDCTLGWPRQRKIGDYYHMVSRDQGADLAWAATFNGEQDVYYLHVPAPPATIASARDGGSPAASSAAEREERFGFRAGSPNPFRAATSIRFEIPEPGRPVKLEVFDASGRRVRTLVDGRGNAGIQTVRWPGTDDQGRAVKSGLYVCRLRAGDRVASLKLVLSR